MRKQRKETHRDQEVWRCLSSLFLPPSVTTMSWAPCSTGGALGGLGGSLFGWCVCVGACQHFANSVAHTSLSYRSNKHLASGSPKLQCLELSTYLPVWAASSFRLANSCRAFSCRCLAVVVYVMERSG